MKENPLEDQPQREAATMPRRNEKMLGKLIKENDKLTGKMMEKDGESVISCAKPRKSVIKAGKSGI